MRQYIEFPLFTLVAAGLLMAGFSISPPDDASAAAGAGGEDLVTLQASTASVESMVDDWLEPPEVAETPQAPDIAQDAPEMSTPDAASPAITAPDDAPRMPTPAAPALPQAPSLPDAALAELPPPPDPVPEPEPSSEPEPEPEPEAQSEPEAEAQPVPEPEPEAEAEPEVTVSETAPRSSERPQERPDRPVRERTEPAPREEPAETPGNATADSAAQRSAGSGGGAQAGQSREGRTATSTRAEQNSLKASWGAAIRTRVEQRKRYPGRAGRASGAVVLTLNVTSSGALAGVGISRSSGNALLDQAAVDAVRNARMPAAPRGLAPGTHSFSLPIRFSR